MKDRLPLNEDMEVMLTSYLLGELGDSDVRKVELALKDDPNLRAVAKELEASISVIRQATSTVSGESENEPQVPHKLSSERRNDLIKSLREHDVGKSKNIRQLPWFIPMGIAAGLIALLSAYSFMLQTQSRMKDAAGAAEYMVANSNTSRFETVELFSNSMTPMENEARKSAQVDKFHFFRTPVAESDREFNSQTARFARKVVDNQEVPQSTLSFGLENDFKQPPSEVERKNRSWFESGNESLERVREKAQIQVAQAVPSPSFGRALRRKALQKSEGSSQGNGAAGATMLGVIEQTQKENTNSDVITSLSDGIVAENTIALSVLPALESPQDLKGIQDGVTVTEKTPEADFAWGAGDTLDAIQPPANAAKGIEELAKRRNVERWAFQAPEEEALFDSGRGRGTRKSPAVAKQLENFEKRVSPGPQFGTSEARYGLRRDVDRGDSINQAELGFGEVPPTGELEPDASHQLFAKKSNADAYFDDSLASESLSEKPRDFSGSMEGYSGGAGGGDMGGMAMRGFSAGNQLAVESDDLSVVLEGEALGTPLHGGFRDSGLVPNGADATDADETLAYGFQPASPSLGVSRQAEFSDTSSKPALIGSSGVAVEEPVQRLFRGQMLGEQLLGEQESSKSFQRESQSVVPSLGKEAVTRSAGRFGDVMQRLDDLGDLEALATRIDLDDNVVREDQVMLQRFQKETSPLQQLNEKVLSQTVVPGQIEAKLSELSSAFRLGRIQEENVRPNVLSLATQPAPTSKPIAADNVDHRPELETTQESTSTFSLNVSDVSFKLAKAALAESQLPDSESIRSEQFLNAFDYRDPAPYSNQSIGFYSEQAQHPFAHHRNVVRFALQTAASGRTSERPMHLTILLDNSGSMERNDRREILSQALNVLSQKLTAKDKISVVSFARTARLWVDGAEGGSPVVILEKVNNLIPQGGTNIEEALNAAYEVASDHYVKNGINRVVLLTDGAANLGNVDPEVLKQKVVKERKRGIAFDCFGIGWDGLNDPLLEVLSRNGDGRYGFLNNPSDASSEFADQLAGALNVAASDVKVQVEFNSDRVKRWRQVGYAKHQLTKEQFRDNTVDAAEIAAAESGNALYVFEPIENGSGPVGQVRVRYRVPHTSEYREKEWTVPYKSSVPAAEDSSAAMKLALASGLFAEWLNGNPHAGSISLDALGKIYRGVPETFGEDPRPYELQQMFEQARRVSDL